MKDWEIFNIALHCMGRSCTKEQAEAEHPSTEIDYCRTYLPHARLRALSESDWSWFLVPVPIDEENDVPGLGYRHGWMVPFTVLHLAPPKDVASYQFLGGRFYADRRPKALLGVPEYYTELPHPEDYDWLVAYSLAAVIAPLLAPGDGNVMNVALQGYAWALGNCRMLEVRNNSKDSVHDWDDDDDGTVPRLSFHG